MITPVSLTAIPCLLGKVERVIYIVVLFCFFAETQPYCTLSSGIITCMCSQSKPVTICCKLTTSLILYKLPSVELPQCHDHKEGSNSNSSRLHCGAQTIWGHATLCPCTVPGTWKCLPIHVSLCAPFMILSFMIGMINMISVTVVRTMNMIFWTVGRRGRCATRCLEHSDIRPRQCFTHRQSPVWASPGVPHLLHWINSCGQGERWQETW